MKIGGGLHPLCLKTAQLKATSSSCTLAAKPEMIGLCDLDEHFIPPGMVRVVQSASTLLLFTEWDLLYFASWVVVAENHLQLAQSFG